jgi:hypothetical protein
MKPSLQRLPNDPHAGAGSARPRRSKLGPFQWVMAKETKNRVFSAAPSVSRYADTIRRLGKDMLPWAWSSDPGIDGRGGAARHISQLRCVVRGQADMESRVPWIRGLTIEKSRSAEGKFLDFASFSFGFPSFGLENASSAPDKVRSGSAPTRRALQARENGQPRRDGVVELDQDDERKPERHAGEADERAHSVERLGDDDPPPKRAQQR